MIEGLCYTLTVSIQEIITRLLVALVFSGAVGLQRGLTGKAAGMRTHIIVGVGAALFLLVSEYGFESVLTSSQMRFDPSRVAAQIVSGIGFIGGGAILKERGSIKGITTAAGIWAAAAVGTAAGAGLYAMGGIATALILITLVVLRRVEIHFPRRALEPWTIRLTLTEGATLQPLNDVLTPRCNKVSLVRLAQSDSGDMRLTFVVEVPHHFDIMALMADLRAAGARLVEWSAGGNAAGED